MLADRKEVEVKLREVMHERDEAVLAVKGVEEQIEKKVEVVRNEFERFVSPEKVEELVRLRTTEWEGKVRGKEEEVERVQREMEERVKSLHEEREALSVKVAERLAKQAGEQEEKLARVKREYEERVSGLEEELIVRFVFFL